MMDQGSALDPQKVPTFRNRDQAPVATGRAVSAPHSDQEPS